jgi:hypothetical protein
LLTLCLIALAGQRRVVQFFDLGREVEDGLPAGDHFFSQEARALGKLFGRRPIEQRIEFPPVLDEARTQRRQPLHRAWIAPRDRTQLVKADHVLPAIVRNLSPVERRAFAIGVEQVVADVNPRQVDVGAEPAQLSFDFMVPGVHLVELGEERLRAARRFEHHRYDQQQQCP